jgi:hypothetical protein
MAGHVVIRIAERLGGGEPLRTAYAVAEPNQHRAIALFKLRPDHTADEQVEAVVELTQSALDSVGLVGLSDHRRFVLVLVVFVFVVIIVIGVSRRHRVALAGDEAPVDQPVLGEALDHVGLLLGVATFADGC